MEDDWDHVDDCALQLNIQSVPKKEQKVTETTISNDDEWDVPLVKAASVPAASSSRSRVFTEDREPIILILVDLTVLSNGSIHNQFDKHSVNDPEAKKKLCDTINAQYSFYANNSTLISEGTVRHCSERVWRDALEDLRKEFKGHYWFPFFPPKEET